MEAGKMRKRIKRLFILTVLVCLCYCIWQWGVPLARLWKLNQAQLPQQVEVNLIDVDGHSRRGEKLEGLRDVVIHYVGNPGTSAKANRNWYENPQSQVSSHFIVGLEGEIIQCVPLDEKSSASNWRNGDTISIEVCHPDETGKFNAASYEALVDLTAWLLDAGALNENHVIRHYDITGKDCPIYYVEHEQAWQRFLSDVQVRRGGTQ